MINFKELSPRDFESLIGLLLTRDGFEIIRGPGRGDIRGPDYEVRRLGESPVFLVEVKHFRLPLGRTQVIQFADDLERYRKQRPDARGLLVASGQFSAAARDAAANNPHLELWDGAEVQARYAKYSDFPEDFQQYVQAREALHQFLFEPSKPFTRSDQLAAALTSISCGQGEWKKFEQVCTEILTHVFTPELAPPDIQSRSDDGLDIIDAVFAIRSHVAPWSLLRAEFTTRFVVAEFKNFCEMIGQAQVESIAQYLWRPAQRNFGLLVSRESPSASAVAQRRRKWLEENKCIVFLSDEDLLEMLAIKDSGGQPYDVIDTQLEDFYRTLTP
jgi:Restriction endonuclease